MDDVLYLVGLSREFFNSSYYYQVIVYTTLEVCILKIFLL